MSSDRDPSAKMLRVCAFSPSVHVSVSVGSAPVIESHACGRGRAGTAALAARTTPEGTAAAR
ncbi:hypothetical protein [Leifsonia xyli]|uniref:hypothetical protein n=1 Tax=Leifsonia xyli TaxID=1575 RepID=UPI0002FFE5DB|nr:hypothetical protein [Leifsonia xyli]